MFSIPLEFKFYLRLFQAISTKPILSPGSLTGDRRSVSPLSDRRQSPRSPRALTRWGQCCLARHAGAPTLCTPASLSGQPPPRSRCIQVFVHDDRAGHAGWPDVQNQVVYHGFQRFNYAAHGFSSLDFLTHQFEQEGDFPDPEIVSTTMILDSTCEKIEIVHFQHKKYIDMRCLSPEHGGKAIK